MLVGMKLATPLLVILAGVCLPACGHDVDDAAEQEPIGVLDATVASAFVAPGLVCGASSTLCGHADTTANEEDPWTAAGTETQTGPVDPDDPWAVPKGADPWLVAVPTQDGPRPELTTVRRAVFDADGAVQIKTVVFPQLRWATDADPLASFDVRALVPRSRRSKALAGGEPTSASALLSTSPGKWWRDLAHAILAHDAAETWASDKTLLAWDAAHGRLLVRNTEAVLRRVASALDERDSQRATPVRLILSTPGEAGSWHTRFTVDVPWQRTVHAMRGTAWSYMHDFDLEISMDVWLTPVFDVIETGLGLAAGWSASNRHPEGEIRAHVARREEAPVFRRFDAILAHRDDVAIELPHVAQHVREVRLPARAGARATVHLKDGFLGVLEVVADPLAPRRRRWRREDAAMYEAASVTCDVTLRGSRSGMLGRGTATLPAQGGETQVILRKNSARWTCLERPAGRITCTLTCFDPTRTRAPMDVVLAATEWTGASRSFPVAPPKRDVPTVDQEFPTSHARLTSRCMVLERERAASLSFTADMGNGPERFTLSVARVK